MTNQPLNEAVVTYTNNSTALERRHCILGRVYFVVSIVSLAGLFYPGVPLDLTIFGWVTLGPMLVLPSMYLSMPWELSLDSDLRLCQGSFGFRPFTVQFQGTYDEIVGVGFRSNYRSVFIKLRGRGIKRDFVVDTRGSLEEAREGALELAGKLGLPLISISKTCEPEPVRDWMSKDVVLYTQYSAAKSRSGRLNIIISVIVSLLLPLACVYAFFVNHINNSGELAALFGSSWLFASSSALSETPWYLKLNFAEKTYLLTVGYKPFVRQFPGRFDQCRGIAVQRLYSGVRGCPFAVALRLDQGRRQRNFPIETSCDLTEAVMLAKDLALRLESKVVDSDGTAVNSDRLGEFADYSHTSTRYERVVARDGVRALAICLFLIPAATACYFVIRMYINVLPFYLSLCFLFAMLEIMGIRHVLNGTSWRFSFDHQSRTVLSEVHFGPFVKRASCSFDSVETVAYESGVYDPYLIKIAFRKNNGKKVIRIEAANTLESARARVAQYTEWLRM